MLKRLMVVLAIIALLLPAGAAANSQPKDAWRREQVRYRNYSGGPDFNYEEIVLSLRAANAHWPVSGGVPKLMAVVDCESGFGPRATNPNGHYGLFQNSSSMWSGLLRSPLVNRWNLSHSVFNARSSIVLNVRHIHYYGWGAWTCA